jgi:hypothetical protein
MGSSPTLRSPYDIEHRLTRRSILEENGTPADLGAAEIKKVQEAVSDEKTCKAGQQPF